MNPIEIEQAPSKERLEELGVFGWSIWEKEESEFPWHYDAQETCYLLEGEVTVTPDGGESVSFKAGDLVTFPQGMSCSWKISRAVRKHYRFG
ncbi:MAG: cupin domain-containing protein [Pontiella sp.]|nr:cupin domain-containing protein [Pontiella sp.]